MAQNDILLISEKFVKSITNISDNVAGKFLLPAIREAQEIYLRRFLGDCMMVELKIVAFTYTGGDAPEPTDPAYPYWMLLTSPFFKYYLAYQAVTILTNIVTYKVGNFGVSKSTDENLQVATPDEIAGQQEYYQSMADAYALDMLNYVWNTRGDYPALRECDCNHIHANLHSAATCGVWLGGPRGKILPGGGGCCNKR